MKNYIVLFFMMLLFFGSCEKDVIIIVEEQEIIIDSIDMDQYRQRHLESFSLTRERPFRGGMEYLYESDIDTSYIFIDCILFSSYDEAQLFITGYIREISAYMYPRTEEIEPLGNEYWRNPSVAPISNILVRRYNAVFTLSSHNGDVTPFARKLDDDILNEEDYVIFEGK